MAYAIIRFATAATLNRKHHAHVVGESRPDTNHPDRLHLNQSGGDFEAARRKLNQARRRARLRKKRGRKSRPAVELLFAGPPPWHATKGVDGATETAWPEEKVEAWRKGTLAWVAQTFPGAPVAGWGLHQDENSPHMHVQLIPLTRDGDLSWKRCQTEAMGVPARHPNRKVAAMLLDSYHAAVAHLGMERGQSRSTARNIPLTTVEALRRREAAVKAQARAAKQEAQEAQEAKEAAVKDIRAAAFARDAAALKANRAEREKGEAERIRAEGERQKAKATQELAEAAAKRAATDSRSMGVSRILTKREADIGAKEANVGAREADLAEREVALIARETAIAEREASVGAREDEAARREGEVADKEARHRRRVAAAGAERVELWAAQQTELATRRARLEEDVERFRERRLETRAHLDELRAGIEADRRELDQRIAAAWDEIDEHMAHLEERENALEEQTTAWEAQTDERTAVETALARECDQAYGREHTRAVIADARLNATPGTGLSPTLQDEIATMRRGHGHQRADRNHPPHI